MHFSLEITMKTDLSTLPKVKDVYITMLPGDDYKEVAKKALELVNSGFNPVPHFPARSIKNISNLKDYVKILKLKDKRDLAIEFVEEISNIYN